MTPRRLSQFGIVALLAAYACFAWPGLYHLAAHVLKVGEQVTVGPMTVRRAWLYPAAVDGGIFVAGCVLLTQPRLAAGLRRELWAGMWSCAALSGLGLYVDEIEKGVNRAVALLVLAPVVIATWFLHMVVRVQGDAAGEVTVREEDTDAGGSVAPVPGSPAPAVGELLSTVAGSPSNGHGKTLVARAVASATAFEQQNGRRPNRKELATVAACSESTARDALAALTKEMQ